MNRFKKLRNLQDNIKLGIKERGINVNQLTQEIGCGGSAIYDILKSNSSNPSVFLIDEIAQALDSSVEELLYDTSGNKAELT